MPARNGAAYELDYRGSPVNPFWVLGILPSETLTLPELQRFVRLRVSPHVVERDATKCGKTTGPNVPLWRQTNAAIQGLQSNKDFASAIRHWTPCRPLLWNPLAAPGSDAARQPPPTPPSSNSAHGSPSNTAAAGALPTPSASPEKPRLPRDRDAASGTATNPIELPQSDDSADDGVSDNDIAGEDIVEYVPAPGAAVALLHGINQPIDGIVARNVPLAIDGVPKLPRPERRGSGGSSHNRRRTQVVGVCLGTWSHSGLPAEASNAVYGSRDKRGRINRRISKQTMGGVLVVGGSYSCYRTSCSHDDIVYVEHLAGLSKADVDALVGTQLAIAGGQLD